MLFLFMHKLYLEVNEIFVQFHCSSSYRKDRFPLGVRGEEVLERGGGGGRGEGEGGRERGRDLILLSPLFVSLFSFPPEKPDTQANSELTLSLSY